MRAPTAGSSSASDVNTGGPEAMRHHLGALARPVWWAGMTEEDLEPPELHRSTAELLRALRNRAADSHPAEPEAADSHPAEPDEPQGSDDQAEATVPLVPPSPAETVWQADELASEQASDEQEQLRALVRLLTAQAERLEQTISEEVVGAQEIIDRLVRLEESTAALTAAVQKQTENIDALFRRASWAAPAGPPAAGADIRPAVTSDDSTGQSPSGRKRRRRSQDDA